MKHAPIAALFILPGLLASAALAQTTIGGGSCNSATASGTYAVSITGRQVTTSGNFTNVFQANGSATFDGLSKVTIALTEDTGSVAGTPLTWTGTYTVQANCAATVTVTSGGSATLNLALYATGGDFVITGNDATYSYSGTGIAQPAGCSASTFAGVYAISGTGYSLSSTTVNGAAAVSGLLQLEGQSVITANLSLIEGTTTATATLTGSYSVSSNCTGSATLTDS